MIITYLKDIGYDYLPLPKGKAKWAFNSDGSVTCFEDGDKQIIQQRLDAGLDMLGGVTGDFFIDGTLQVESGVVITGLKSCPGKAEL